MTNIQNSITKNLELNFLNKKPSAGTIIESNRIIEYSSKVDTEQMDLLSNHSANNNSTDNNVIDQIENQLEEARRNLEVSVNAEMAGDCQSILNRLRNEIDVSLSFKDYDDTTIRNIIDGNYDYINYDIIKSFIENNNIKEKSISDVMTIMQETYEAIDKSLEATQKYWENQLRIENNIQRIEGCRNNSDFESVVSQEESHLSSNLNELLEKLHSYDSLVEDEGGLQYILPDILSEVNLLAEIRNNYDEIKEYLDTNNATNDRYTDLLLNYFKIAECLSTEEIKTYGYLLGTEGYDAATDYLSALEDHINQRRGMIDAYEWLQNRQDESTILSIINTFFSGQDSGTACNLIGIQNSLLADGTLTAEQYKQQYIVALLKQYYPNIYSTIYNAGISLGNMLPMITLNLTGFGFVSTLAAGAEMYAATWGNTYNETILQGYNSEDASTYAERIALIETIGDMLLGTLPGVAVTKLSDYLGINNKLVNELIDLLQEIGSENLQNVLEGNTAETILGQEYNINLEEITETTLVSIILRMTMGGSAQVFDIMTPTGPIEITIQNEQLMELIENGEYTPENLRSLITGEPQTAQNIPELLPPAMSPSPVLNIESMKTDIHSIFDSLIGENKVTEILDRIEIIEATDQQDWINKIRQQFPGTATTEGLQAFVDNATGNIYLPSFATQHALYHEVMHALSIWKGDTTIDSNGNTIAVSGIEEYFSDGTNSIRANEGLTDYLADKLDDQQIRGGQYSFIAEYWNKIDIAIAKETGDSDYLMKSYINNDVESIRNFFDDNVYEGAYDDFVIAITNTDFNKLEEIVNALE